MTRGSTVVTAPARQNGAAHDEPALAQLAAAMDREGAIALELAEALVGQRAAVARDVPDAVHSSCDDMGRLLVTLEAAKRQRHALLAQLAGEAAPTLEALARSRAGTLPPALEASRVRLRAAAQTLAREAGTNREVLRRSVAAGEAWLQALFSAIVEPDPTYRANERREDGGAGMLLDRKA